MTKQKRSTRTYWICLLIYVAVLCCLACYGLKLVWSYAEEYEAARPTKVVDEYVANLNETLWGDTIADTISAMPHEVQSDEECAEIIKQLLSEGVTYVRKAGGNSGDLTAVYSLRCNNSECGTVTIMQDESKKDEVKFGMLPWVVCEDSFDFKGLYSSVQITVPSTYSVYLNDVKLGNEYIIEKGIHYDVLEDYYKDYASLPTKVTYKFDNVFGKIDPVVKNEDGEVVTIDPNKDDSQFVKPCDDAQFARLSEFATAFATRYCNYIAGVDDPTYGYQKLMPYIKLGSDIDERMKAALDGLEWSHTHSVSINSVVLNSAVELGDGFYTLDINAVVTSLSPQGENVDDNHMRVIVVESGNDIRAVTMELI